MHRVKSQSDNQTILNMNKKFEIKPHFQKKSHLKKINES
jgi:hypothetical protein